MAQCRGDQIRHQGVGCTFTPKGSPHLGSLLILHQCYWSALDGADGITWADAHLTPLGESQAKDVHDLWSTQLALGIPHPETYYVSPLTRTIQTADLSFSSLPLPASKPYKPLIKELLREALGVHTCDRRSTASHLRATYPHLSFEPGFSEQDMLWQPDYREPRSAREYRLKMLLDEVFEVDEGVFLSFTSHSGAIGAVLRSVGHRVSFCSSFFILFFLSFWYGCALDSKTSSHEKEKEGFLFVNVSNWLTGFPGICPRDRRRDTRVSQGRARPG